MPPAGSLSLSLVKVGFIGQICCGRPGLVAEMRGCRRWMGKELLSAGMNRDEGAAGETDVK